MVVLMYILAVLGVAAVVFMLLKKMDIKITLLVVGMLLGIAAMIMKKVNLNSPADYLYPLQMIVNQLKSTLPSSGLIILVLGGYTAYMSHIGANEVTVHTLTKPLKGIKSVYILVPLVFLLGNLLSLVIPSASNLAIILLATLYPVLITAGMSKLTAAAVIATTATVMPTPLGADNIAIAKEFAEYLGITFTASDYVFKYHAIVSIPTLLVMALVHYFWQKRSDKKDDVKGVQAEPLAVDKVEVKEVTGGKLYKAIYTILPLFPIILLLLTYFVNLFIDDAAKQISLSVEIATLFSFFIAIICELVRNKEAKKTLESTETFFKGMGNAVGIVALLVSAGVFVDGLKAIGVISHLQSTMQSTSLPGFVLPLILVILTAVIVLLSGSGTALFYAMVPLMIPLATAANISPLAVTIPMGLAGNLLRAVSPVSAVIVIVAGTVKENPMKIVKRTSIPMVAGTVFMFILSMILFLTGMVSL